MNFFYYLFFFFAYKCLNMKLLIYALYYAEFNYLKNAHLCIHSIADLNTSHCVELTFLEGKLVSFHKIKVFKFIAF